MSIDPRTARDRGDELRSEARASLWRLAGPWWVFLLTGIAWLIISVSVLALLNGITQIVLAFELKSAQHR